jgi:hypothetical protein
MAHDAPIPNWAKNKRTLIRMNVAIGAVLTILLVGVALIAPTALSSVVGAFSSPFLLIGLVMALLVVSGVRRAVLGPARKQQVRANALLVTYVLSALPLGVAVLLLGALVTVALVFQWQPRFALVQSLVLLVVGFVVFSMSVKTILNAQMLMRHWSGR